MAPSSPGSRWVRWRCGAGRGCCGLHLPALAWGVWIEASAGICPLTPLEMALRHRAGQRGYEGSFIDHHLGALIYPQGLTPAAQWRIALVLAAFNLVLYGADRLAPRARAPHALTSRAIHHTQETTMTHIQDHPDRASTAAPKC